MKKYRAYTTIILLLSVIILAGIFAANMLIDPLWYNKGNQLQPFNFSFNERLAKTNRYLNAKDEHNCIIFGSSVVTLVDEGRIKDYKCYNFAISAGNIKEFIAQAEYIKSLGISPDLVILGVDYFNFMDEPLKNETPDFVLNKTSPPSMLSAYLSYDTLRFSIRSLQRKAPRNRNYDRDFKGFIISGAKGFDPHKERDIGDLFEIHYAAEPLSNDNVKYYKKFRTIFPDAKYIGYVPLKSAWDTHKFLEKGLLENALEVIYETGAAFDEFYDFSLYSPLASRTTDTYDGYHYGRDTNNYVVDGIFGPQDEYHLKVHEMSQKDYINAYIERLSQFDPNMRTDQKEE